MVGCLQPITQEAETGEWRLRDQTELHSDPVYTKRNKRKKAHGAFAFILILLSPVWSVQDVRVCSAFLIDRRVPGCSGSRQDHCRAKDSAGYNPLEPGMSNAAFPQTKTSQDLPQNGTWEAKNMRWGKDGEVTLSPAHWVSHFISPSHSPSVKWENVETVIFTS